MRFLYIFRFTLGEVVVLVAKASDKKDTPYLMFRVNRLCIDAGITVYGVAAQASLGGIQMVDKIHTGKKKTIPKTFMLNL